MGPTGAWQADGVRVGAVKGSRGRCKSSSVTHSILEMKKCVVLVGVWDVRELFQVMT